MWSSCELFTSLNSTFFVSWKSRYFFWLDSYFVFATLYFRNRRKIVTEVNRTAKAGWDSNFTNETTTTVILCNYNLIRILTTDLSNADVETRVNIAIKNFLYVFWKIFILFMRLEVVSELEYITYNKAFVLKTRLILFKKGEKFFVFSQTII